MPRDTEYNEEFSDEDREQEQPSALETRIATLERKLDALIDILSANSVEVRNARTAGELSR